MISKLVEEGRWECTRVVRRGPMISHLVFVDNLLIFIRASENQITCLMEIVHRFCYVLGQKISFEKSSDLLSHIGQKRV